MPPVAATPVATTLAPGVSLLDLRFQGVSGAVAAYLIAHGDARVLVETGPGSTLPALRDAAAAAGHALADVTHVVVTHIHLDHAGAAGAVLREAPRARLYVHPAGAAHLVDPSKLIASASRIYGDRMDALWGAFLPVPADRLSTLADGEAIPLGGGRALTAWHTPGHASHHVALHDGATGDVYTGDVAGVRLSGAPHLRAPTPPPDVDLAAWDASLRRLRALAPARLLLTHFGAAPDPEWHLDELHARLHAFAGWVEGRLDAPDADPASLGPAVADRGAAALARALPGADPAALAALTEAYELANPSYMQAAGMARYLKKRESEKRES
ncbi:MBL fold metallo-hydrolase [Roseisolibacter sp. H3M3-2]|uniref:MBL fold metallo-hydrolase n=1 Tax=Roseisolibacter sp. H3M3-2 TaxID=3031323 RepID=UPI0023DB5D39|nr:MBL fold metallo-hydrolase [Roseisolibacter sp. H3M3-2]MDF1502429.1 MBL fold metallo-hydrolase [Roseisolibacter sp. H3M3-2]